MHLEALKIILFAIRDKRPKIILSSRKEISTNYEHMDKNIIPSISTFN